MYALTDCTLFTGDHELQGQGLVIDGKRIVDIVPEAQLGSDLPRLNGQGCLAAPGFIDLQLNGCGGVMFNDAIAPITLDRMHQTNLRSGTTSFLPTLITTSDEAMRTAMAVVAGYRQQAPEPVLGLHLEGPYLNIKRKGIHAGSYVRSPDATMIAAIAAVGPEVVRLITLAPEQVPPEQIQQLAAAGILVAAGHSDATYEDAIAGFKAGIGMVTHLFNAMSPWTGRQPGLVGATFSRSDIYAGIIADGHHVHFGSIAIAQKLLQHRLILVSDAMPPVGAAIASFVIGGQEVFYQEGKCVSADGTLGGSALTMSGAIANCVNQAGLPLAEALRMATLYPAQAISCDDRLGRLRPGYLANLALLSPSLEVLGVLDRGQALCFSSEFARSLKPEN